MAISLTAVAICRYTDPSLVQLGRCCNSHDSKEQAGSQPPCAGVMKALLRRPVRWTLLFGGKIWLANASLASTKLPLTKIPRPMLLMWVLGVTAVGRSGYRLTWSFSSCKTLLATATMSTELTVHRRMFELGSVPFVFTPIHSSAPHQIIP